MDLMAFKGEKWIDIEGDFKVKVDYPTREQKYKLKKLQGETSRIKDPSKYIDGGDVDLNDIEVDAGKQSEYQDFYLKCVVKDWQGVKDGEDELLCRVENDELADDLWEAMCVSPYADEIFNKVFEALRWTEIDKKK